MVEPGERSDGRPPGPASVPKTILPTHGTTRYLRVAVEVTDGVVRWQVPRTVLGIIPIGRRQIEVPVADVRVARMTRVVYPVRLLAAAALVALPFLFVAWWLAVPMVLLGLWVVLASLGPHLEVVTNAGARHRAAVCFGHQLDAELYLEAVNDLAGGNGAPPSGSGD